MKAVVETIMRHVVNASIRAVLACIDVLRIGMRTTSKRTDILLIKLEAIGDFVMWIPSLKLYRAHFAGKHLTVLVDNKINVGIANALKEEGYIDEVIYINSHKFATNMWYRFLRAKQIHDLRASVAVYATYYRRHMGNFITRVSGAKKRYGFAGKDCQEDGKKLPQSLFTSHVTLENIRTPEFRKNIMLAEHVTNKTYQDVSPSIPIPDAARNKAAEVLAANKLTEKHYIIVAPGAGAAIRMWPPERFAAVIAHAYKTHNLPTVVVGAPSEKQLAEDIQSHIPDIPLVSVIGDISILELAALCERAALYVGGDTGPVHISAAAESPCLCIMGGGVLKQFFPYGDTNKNRVVYDAHMTCKNDNWACTKDIPPGSPAPCIDAISTDMVTRELDDMVTSLGIV